MRDVEITPPPFSRWEVLVETVADIKRRQDALDKDMDSLNVSVRGIDAIIREQAGTRKVLRWLAGAALTVILAVGGFAVTALRTTADRAELVHREVREMRGESNSERSRSERLESRVERLERLIIESLTKGK